MFQLVPVLSTGTPPFGRRTRFCAVVPKSRCTVPVMPLVKTLA
jgi:hypothetical protein